MSRAPSAILARLQAVPVEGAVEDHHDQTRLLVAVGAALTVLALVVRWRALPDDGLRYDDAWVLLGASRGSPGELLSVSTMHPGFSAFLMAWSKLVPATTTWIALPALLAGALLPATVLWACRRLDVRPLVAVAVAVLAVFAPTHVVYSGRIKPYTLLVADVQESVDAEVVAEQQAAFGRAERAVRSEGGHHVDVEPLRAKGSVEARGDLAAARVEPRVVGRHDQDPAGAVGGDRLGDPVEVEREVGARDLELARADREQGPRCR